MEIQSHAVRLLAAAVDASSIEAAARNANSTPAAVTAALQRLDDELGFPVLVRGRPLRLTDAGELFLAEARRLIGGLTEIERRLSERTDSTARTTMALQPDLGATPFGALTGGFSAMMPSATLSLLQVPTVEAAFAALRKGVADTAFVSALDVPHEFERVTLDSTRLVLVLPGSWAKVSSVADLADHGRFPFIEGRRAIAQSWSVDALRRVHVQPVPVMRNAPVSLAAQLVVAGVGAALVPELLAQVLANEGCQCVSDTPALDVPVHLVRRPGLTDELTQALFITASNLARH